MSYFKITCPYCSAELQVEEKWRGMVVECPTCKHSLMAREVEDVWGSIEERYEKSASRKNLILVILLCTVIFLVAGGWVYQHISEKQRIARRKLAAEQRRLAEQKHLEEQKRLAALKLQEDTIVIKREIARAGECATPREAYIIVEKLARDHRRHPMISDIRAKCQFYQEGIYIREEIKRIEKYDNLQRKIGLLESIERRYPKHLYIEEVKALVKKYQAEKAQQEAFEEAKRKKIAEIEAKQAESRRKIAEANRKIREQRAKEEREREAREEKETRYQRSSYSGNRVTRRTTSYSSAEKCRWCNGSGRRNSFSKFNDCTMCDGTGKKTSAKERLSMRKCQACDGTGRGSMNSKCRICGGDGRLNKNERQRTNYRYR